MQKLAPVFLRYGAKLENLNALTGTVAQPSRHLLTEALHDARSSRFQERDLPIYGARQGEQAGFVDNDTTKALDWTYTPPELVGVKGAFALFVNGDSMTDAGLRAGATVHVHPHRPPRVGDFCVLVKHDLVTLIKRFEGERGGKIILWQSNPKESFDVPVSDVRALFSITSANFVR
jgi:phage repressor protein C with HTH and peptisase S24 domain